MLESRSLQPIPETKTSHIVAEPLLTQLAMLQAVGLKGLLQMEAAVFPMEQATRSELHEGHTGLMLTNCNILVTQYCQQNEDHSPRWELDHKFQVPKDKVPTELRIVVPKCNNAAPACCQVIERVAQHGVRFEDIIEVLAIMLVQVGGEQVESACLPTSALE